MSTTPLIAGVVMVLLGGTVLWTSLLTEVLGRTADKLEIAATLVALLGLALLTVASI